jgi:hypothetical protein
VTYFMMVMIIAAAGEAQLELAPTEALPSEQAEASPRPPTQNDSTRDPNGHAEQRGVVVSAWAPVIGALAGATIGGLSGGVIAPVSLWLAVWTLAEDSDCDRSPESCEGLGLTLYFFTIPAAVAGLGTGAAVGAVVGAIAGVGVDQSLEGSSE